MMAVAETTSSSKPPSAISKAQRGPSKCSKSAKGDRFTLSKVLLAQWIQAQAATIFIVNICVSSLFTTAQSANSVRDARNFVRFSQSQEVGSQITTQGNLSLNAGANINATAANIQSQQSTQLSAAGSVNLTEGVATRSLQEAQFASTKGFMSSRSFTSRVTEGSTQSIGTNVGGNTVNVTANQDINIKGSSVIADTNATLSAGNNINIEAATNTARNTSFVETKESGFLSGGGFGISYGKREQSTDQKNQNTTAAASTVGAIGGNVNINAGQTFRQVGSDIIAPTGDINITAKKVDIVEARETNKQSTEQKFEQSGLTLAVTSGLVSNLQGAQKQQQAASQTKDDRMKALAVANQVASVSAAAQSAQQLDVSLSIGTSRSQSQQTSQSDTARGSTVAAGGTTTIKAIGAGQASNLNLQGSDVSGKTVNLEADNQVSLLAAANTNSQTSSSSNSSASVGISAGTSGLGVIASASLGRGNGNGTDTSYTNTHITGQDSVSIKSGGDTTLKGATVEGKQVTATVGGSLNIESLQDTSTYKEKNQQLGGSVMVGLTDKGPVKGNINYGQSNINSDYASVAEQSGLKAGDGGFNVNVQGNTDLKGGAITSTQAALDNNKNSFQTGGTLTTSDIQNKASFDAKSVSVTLGMGSTPGQSASAGMSGVGFGTDKGSAGSTTTAGISGIAGDSSKRTGDKQQGVVQIFNKDQVKAEIGAQTAITSEFGKNASKAVGDYAQTKLDEAKANNDQAGIDAWKEGGVNRVALHTVVGGLTFGAQGAVGAATSQAAIDQIGQAIKDTDLPVALKQTLVAAAGTAIGAATGGTAGAASGFNATTNNYLKHTELQSKQQQLAECKDDACRKPVNSYWTQVSQDRNTKTGDSIIAGNEAANLQTMDRLASDMSSLAQYKSGLESQLSGTSDPNQRASIQLQINEADNNIRQVASLGKDALALLYQQTGKPEYQNAFQALVASTSGNELSAAWGAGGIAGMSNKRVPKDVDAPLGGANAGTKVAGANGGVGAAGKTVTGEATAIAPLDWSIVSKTGETRAAHINAQHGNLNLQKPSQGVFYGDPVAVTNDAWAIAQTQGIKPITANGVDIYVIPRPNSGYAGGYKGVGDNLNSVTILTEPGTSKMITSYPGNGTPLPKAP